MQSLCSKWVSMFTMLQISYIIVKNNVSISFYYHTVIFYNNFFHKNLRKVKGWEVVAKVSICRNENVVFIFLNIFIKKNLIDSLIV